MCADPPANTVLGAVARGSEHRLGKDRSTPDEHIPEAEGWGLHR